MSDSETRYTDNSFVRRSEMNQTKWVAGRVVGVAPGMRGICVFLQPYGALGAKHFDTRDQAVGALKEAGLAKSEPNQ